MSIVFFCVTINQDVIEEDQYKYSEIELENVIHQPFESGLDICEAERHYREFIIHFVSPKSYLGNVFFPHF